MKRRIYNFLSNAHPLPYPSMLHPFMRRAGQRPTVSLLGLLTGIMLLASGSTSVSALPTRLSPHDVRIGIPEHSFAGALPWNRGLTVVVQIPEKTMRNGDRLVVVLDSPAFAQQMSPMLLDPDSGLLSATLDVGPLSGSLGNPPRATPVHVSIARQVGMHREELARRTVVITVAVPGSTDGGASPRMIDLSRGFDAVPESDADSNAVVTDATLDEQPILQDSGISRYPGYWHLINGLIRRQLAVELGRDRSPRNRRMPVLHFRLYRSGEAQLIEVERSSGSDAFDQAAVLAVVNAHPFPPFPSPNTEPYVDVHVNLPSM